MRIFVLGTGRCGTTTFAKACSHITNYTSGHETHRDHPERFPVYPDNHIEVDGHLAWMLGMLAMEYPDKFDDQSVRYIHLRRDREAVAKSFLPRHGAQMVGRMLFQRWVQPCDYGDMVRLARIIDANISEFLHTRFHREVCIEQLSSPMCGRETWCDIWNFMEAEGDFDASLNEFNTRYNASKPC